MSWTAVQSWGDHLSDQEPDWAFWSQSWPGPHHSPRPSPPFQSLQCRWLPPYVQSDSSRNSAESDSLRIDLRRKLLQQRQLQLGLRQAFRCHGIPSMLSGESRAWLLHKPAWLRLPVLHVQGDWSRCLCHSCWWRCLESLLWLDRRLQPHQKGVWCTRLWCPQPSQIRQRSHRRYDTSTWGWESQVWLPSFDGQRPWWCLCLRRWRRRTRLGGDLELRDEEHKERRSMRYRPWSWEESAVRSGCKENTPRSLEVEDIVDTIAQGCHISPGGLVGPVSLGFSLQRFGKVRSKRSNVTCCQWAGDPVESDSSGLKSLVYDLEEFPLLRVHGSCFERVDSKERWVKVPIAVIMGEEVASTGNDASPSLGIGMVPSVDIKPVGRYIGLSWSSRDDEIPEFRWWFDISGEAAAWLKSVESPNAGTGELRYPCRRWRLDRLPSRNNGRCIIDQMFLQVVGQQDSLWRSSRQASDEIDPYQTVLAFPNGRFLALSS